MEILTSLRLRIILSFVLCAGVLGAAAFVLYSSSQRTRKKIRTSIFHTRTEINDLQAVLAAVEDAETGQRGYLLTGNEPYLSPYNRALAKIDADLDQLSAFSQEDPQLQADMPSLRAHVDTKIKELKASIGLYRANDVAAAQQMVRAGDGQREMDAIRALITDLLAARNLHLDQLRQEYETNLTKNSQLLGGGIGLQFILLLLVFFFFYRDSANRIRSARETQKAHGRLDAILSTLGDGVYQLDLKGRLVYLNPTGERILGYSRRELKGQNMHDIVHCETPTGEIRPHPDSPLGQMMRSGPAYARPHAQEDYFKRKDGTFITVEYAGAPLRSGEEVLGVVVSFRDISERQRREAELRAVTELQRGILQSANVAIISCEADGMITTFNPAAERMLQYKAEEVVGKESPAIIHDPLEMERRADELSRELRVPVAAGLETFTTKAGRFNQADQAEWTYIRKDGSRFPVSLTITALHDTAGEVSGFIGIAEDITDRKFAEEAIRESQVLLNQALEREKNDARLDFLTKIANRRAFFEVASTEATRSRRYGRPLTLIYIDLDNFKQINDKFGHDVGDELLVEVAATIRTNVRSTDTVARLGGDEFALLLPETDQESAMVVTNKLREALLDSMHRKNWPVTFSIGLASFTTPPESVEEMVKQADAIMYSVKLKGKNSIATA